LKSNKRFGEEAEALVHYRLVQEGFDAAWPSGDSATWDLVSDWRGNVNRLQVKSCRAKDTKTKGVYYIKIAHHAHARTLYEPGDFDFLIAVLPWAIYVIPADLILLQKRICIGFWEDERNGRGKFCEWEKYKEAWSILK